MSGSIDPPDNSDTLTLRPQISRLDRLDDAVWIGSPAGKPMKITRPVLSLRELRATVSVPDQQPLVIGGFKDSVIGEARAGAAAEKRALAPATQPTTGNAPFPHQLMWPTEAGSEVFLFVTPRIILNREAVR